MISYIDTYKDQFGVETIYTQRRKIAVEIDGKLVNVGLPVELLAAGVAANATSGASVSEGDAIATVEAMKMESALKAPRTGTIKLLAKEGDRLTPATVVATID